MLISNDYYYFTILKLNNIMEKKINFFIFINKNNNNNIILASKSYIIKRYHTKYKTKIRISKYIYIYLNYTLSDSLQFIKKQKQKE